MSMSIFSELRESLSSVVKLCSWTWSVKKCVSTVHRDEWVRMEVWDEMCNLDRACWSDASVCENRRIHMWVLLNVTVTEWFDVQTVTDMRYFRKLRTHYRWWLSVECWTWTCASASEMRTVCAVDVDIGTCLSKYASSRVRFHYVLTLFDRMSSLIWFNMRNV